MKAMSNPQSSDINDYIRPGKIFMFSKSGCPYCVTAKSILKKLNLPFEVIDQDITPPPPSILKEAEKLSGMRTVPKIFVGTKLVGGCSDLEAKLKDGRLKDLLESEGFNI